MPIRFHLATITKEQIVHGYSPVLEALISLHSVLEPKHHPVQHPWARKTRALPAQLREEFCRFAFLYDGYAPNFFAATPARPFPAFETELKRIAKLPLAEVRAEFQHTHTYVNVRRHPSDAAPTARTSTTSASARTSTCCSARACTAGRTSS